MKLPSLTDCFKNSRRFFSTKTPFVLTIALIVIANALLPVTATVGKSATRKLADGRTKADRDEAIRRAMHADIEDPREMLREGTRIQAEEGTQSAPVAQKLKKRDNLTPQALTVQTVINTNDAGPGSLRQGLLNSNTDGMPSQIAFNIPTGDPGFDGATFTIKPLTPLPVLSAGDAAVDGTTQTAFTGDTNPLGPEIVINGSMTPVDTDCLVAASAHNTIKSLVINGFHGWEGTAIQLRGLNADYNTVVGCYIGTDATGTSAVRNGGYGIEVLSGSDSNQIGGTTTADRNIVSANHGGIFCRASLNSTTGNNVIQGNYVGVDRTGTISLGNYLEGISVVGTTNNQIGGTAPGAGNVSSGNDSFGMRLSGFIFDLTPTSDPEDKTGPYLVRLATGNLIQGNKFGTDTSGMAAVPNGVDGLAIGYASQHNIVGGTTPEARNICSGNLSHGVHIASVHTDFTPATPTSFNVVQGNYIGTDVTGAAPLGNTQPGVFFYSGASENLLGGTGPGEGNIIAFNTGRTIPDDLGGFFELPAAGVLIPHDPDFSHPFNANEPAVRNRISGNSIHSNIAAFSNDGLGIDLNVSDHVIVTPTDGVTPNDTGDADEGGNGLQNYPVLTAVSSSAASTTIQGTLNSTPNMTFSIEFFANNTYDPSGFGEGETFIGFAPVTTDISGNATFSVTLPVNLGCRTVTATATDALGNTSEFSKCSTDPAPTLSCNVATTELWPADRNLINVGLTAVASDNCSTLSVSVAVYSDEDDEANSNHSPDAKDMAAGMLRLRAERDSGGDGRVYLIIITATDSTGNVTRCCKTVTVPKNPSPAAKQAGAAQAAAAEAYCAINGTAPPSFVVIGDGPLVGPNQ
jgi:hypothetical protein